MLERKRENDASPQKRLDAVKKEFPGLTDFFYLFRVSLFFSLSSKKEKIILKRISFFLFINFDKNIKHFSKNYFLN